MTPFSQAQLKKATKERYLKMKAFNFILSSQRITIERAFSMLVRKFGILWRPLEFPLAQNVNITFVNPLPLFAPNYTISACGLGFEILIKQSTINKWPKRTL